MLVEKRLSVDYKCSFSDCYNHPEYLSIILKEILGDSYPIIINKIKDQLERHSLDNKLVRFIEVLVK